MLIAHQFISKKLLLLLGTYYPFCHKKNSSHTNFFGTCGYKCLISSNYTKEKINFVMWFFRRPALSRGTPLTLGCARCKSAKVRECEKKTRKKTREKRREKKTREKEAKKRRKKNT